MGLVASPRCRSGLLALLALVVTACGSPGGTATVSGTVTYDFVPSVYSPAQQAGTLQFGSATQKPVRGATVQVVQGGTTLATATTGDDGRYTATYTSSAGGGAVTLFVLAKTASPPIQVQDNTSNGTPVWAISSALSGATQTLDLRATHGWTGSTFDATQRTAAPFAILDSMLTATRAFQAAKPGLTFPPLKCNWSPLNTAQNGDKTIGQIGTSHYSPGDNQLYILGKVAVDTDEFDSHVIVHEWGHFFEANLSRSDSPGGRHGGGDVLDPRIAFGEAWGNAVASMVLPESIYSDTSWDQQGHLGGFGFDVETEPTPTDDPNSGNDGSNLWSGAFSEFSIMRFLYDVYDSGAGEAYDQVALGLGPIVDVLTGPEKDTEALTTVGSFVTYLKATAAGGAASTALNTLLAHHHIGPITTIWGGGDTRTDGAGLAAMFTNVASFPYTSSGLGFGGGAAANSWQQNQYFHFVGTGATLTITSTSGQDIDLHVYQKGGPPKAKAEGDTGNETLSLPTTAGLTYVLVVTGYGQSAGDYAYSVSIQ